MQQEQRTAVVRTTSGESRPDTYVTELTFNIPSVYSQQSIISFLSHLRTQMEPGTLRWTIVLSDEN